MSKGACTTLEDFKGDLAERKSLPNVGTLKESGLKKEDSSNIEQFCIISLLIVEGKIFKIAS